MATSYPSIEVAIGKMVEGLNLLTKWEAYDPEKEWWFGFVDREPFCDKEVIRGNNLAMSAFRKQLMGGR